MSINQIAEGTFKNWFNLDNELYAERIAVCHRCKLLKDEKFFGEVCSSSIYLNPITNEVSPVEKPGFKTGCGCVLAAKGRVREAHCPLGKW